MKRIAVIAAVLAAPFLFPAQSPAQSVEEGSCRSAGGPRSLCVGTGKVGERVSAECRRLGITSDATCWSRVGRRVIRSEVADYEKTWVHRALQYQSRLGDAVPFKDAPWPGTHNSTNSTSDDFTVSSTDSNQQLTLTEQLRLDIRSLEVDVHWTYSPRAGGQKAAVVCHGRPPGEMNAGCTSERLLGERLAEVDEWLEANPDEVLLLYLEDAIKDPVGYQAAGKQLEQLFEGQLYAGEPGCQPLPLSLTRDAVRAAGKQVVIVSDCGSGAWAGAVYSWKGNVSSEGQPVGWEGAEGPACPSPGAPTDYATKLVRFYEDSTWLYTSPAGGNADRLTPATVRKMVACGVDLFGFDQLLPFDGRLEALVWSWAPNDPQEGCAAQAADSRWYSRRCVQKLPPACITAGRTWTVLAAAVKHKAAAAACEAAGLELGTPRTGEENAALRAAAGERTVWLGAAPAAKRKNRRR